MVSSPRHVHSCLPRDVNTFLSQILHSLHSPGCLSGGRCSSYGYPVHSLSILSTLCPVLYDGVYPNAGPQLQKVGWGVGGWGGDGASHAAVSGTREEV